MSDQFKDMKNADLKEYCEEEGINVVSKNVSKPTRAEYIESIKTFESEQLGEKVVTDEPETILDEEDDFSREVALIKAEGIQNGLQEEGQKTQKVMSRKERKREQTKELMSLKRVIINSNSTNQTKTNGIERISWGNRLIGHQTDNVVIGKPWHVREGALRNLKNSKISQPIQDDEGNQVRFEVIPAWTIQYLEPLTAEQIKKLAKKQSIRDASIDSLI